MNTMSLHNEPKSTNAAPRRRVLTWHIHGSYLYYLIQSPHEFYLPVRPDRADGYGGAGGDQPWAANVHEVPAEEVKNLDLDVILFQSRQNYEVDQYEILSEEQRELPRIYLEHDPPRQNPTDTRHWVDDPDVLLVHCTPFNQLMWDNGGIPNRYIDHGVIVPPEVQYTGELERGVVVVNNIQKRGRRLGYDIFEEVRQQIPLDIYGINSEELGGYGSVGLDELARAVSQYRFFFNPIRYTSLGLAILEAMMIGMPVIGLATTELVTVVQNGVSGYLETDLNRLVSRMQHLLDHPEEARRLSQGAQQMAMKRFNIHRFANDWTDAFEWVIEQQKTSVYA
jgi:glycosyltransferase involved in cell wall biosynthesis